MRPFLLLCACALAFLVASPAQAAPKCQAPPGTGAVDQYCEVVPGAAGPKSTGLGGRGRAPRAPAPGGIPGGTSRALAGGQPDGGVARVLGAPQSAAGRAAAKPKTGRDGKGKARDAAEPASGGNVLGAVGKAIENGPQIGGGFSWALILIALAMAAVAWFAYRRRGSAGEEA